mmetsp:Transcript_25016/g.38931  ORF Transcript_25016/g.38931 Transcript_25016/m.38931 type:complete len:384 (-) Transcript_25016:9-1160(-)
MRRGYHGRFKHPPLRFTPLKSAIILLSITATVGFLLIYGFALPNATEIPADRFPFVYEKECCEKGGSYDKLKNLPISSVKFMPVGTTPKLLVDLESPDENNYTGVWKPLLLKYSGLAYYELLFYHLVCYFHLRVTPPTFFMKMPIQQYVDNIVWHDEETNQYNLKRLKEHYKLDYVPGIFISWIDGLHQGDVVQISTVKVLEPLLGWCYYSFECRTTTGREHVLDYLVGNWDRYHNQHSVWWLDEDKKMKQALVLLDLNHCDERAISPLPWEVNDCTILNPFFSQMCNSCNDMLLALQQGMVDADPDFGLYLCKKEGNGVRIQLNKLFPKLHERCLKLCSARKKSCNLHLDSDWRQKWSGTFFRKDVCCNNDAVDEADKYYCK